MIEYDFLFYLCSSPTELGLKAAKMFAGAKGEEVGLAFKKVKVEGGDGAENRLRSCANLKKGGMDPEAIQYPDVPSLRMKSL